MVQQSMSGGWTAFGAHLFCFTFFVLVLRIHSCYSLNLEGYALLQFRAKVGFDPSGALANWNPDNSTPCNWSGVNCLDDKVHKLDLNGQGLVGVLVPELASLSHLRVLNLSKNHLSGIIPREFGKLTTLEVLDLRNNKFIGAVPAELGRIHTLKSLLLCNNGFEGNIPTEIRKRGLLNDAQCNEIHAGAVGVGCMNRKLGGCTWQSIVERSQKSYSFLNLFPLFKFGSESLHNLPDHCAHNLIDLKVDNEANQRRILVEQSSNLVAIPPNVKTPMELGPIGVIPSRSSGSFPAAPNMKKLPPAPAPAPPSVSHPTGGKSGHSRKLIVGLSIFIFLLVVASAMLVICRCRAARTIGPWKTGLSGQLQKAFVTGVPKLNRPELETACEDFSNIITTQDGIATVYKGLYQAESRFLLLQLLYLLSKTGQNAQN